MSAGAEQISGHMSESDTDTHLTNQPQHKSLSVGLSLLFSEEEDFQA